MLMFHRNKISDGVYIGSEWDRCPICYSSNFNNNHFVEFKFTFYKLIS